MSQLPEDLSKGELFRRLASELGPDLTELTPKEGVQRYQSYKEPEVTPATLKEYRGKFENFLVFCDQHEIEDLRDLGGRTIHDYQTWLRKESSDDVEELAPNTMRDEMFLFRSFLDFLAKIEAVNPELSESVTIPKLSDGEGVRDVELAPDRVRAILSHLEQFHHASLDHVVWLLLVKTGRRTGCIHSLDVPHVCIEQDKPYLEFRHLPTQTRLKNGEQSEAHVAIPDDVASVIRDYLEHHRPDTEDAGREPLLATEFGRISKSTIRKIVYAWSRPCAVGAECPHDRNKVNCDAANTRNAASQCPSSRSPHTLRHGYITEGLRREIPLDVLSDRCDVSEATIRKHYSELTESERCDIRRRVLDEYSDENGGGYL